jgi:hypothetical protein
MRCCVMCDRRNTISLTTQFLAALTDLLKTKRRDIPRGQAKVRQFIIPQKCVWITNEKRLKSLSLFSFHLNIFT